MAASNLNAAPGWDDASTAEVSGCSLLDIFTEDERKGIEELRSRLKDLCDSPMNQWTREYIAEDATLWRYVLAKSREVNPMDASEHMFRSSVAWREEIDMNSLLAQWRLPNSTTSDATTPAGSRTTNLSKKGSARARLGDLCIYTGMMARTTVDGAPVLVERLGMVDLPGLYHDPYALECTTKSYIVYLEEAWNTVRATGAKTRGHIVIDISGVGLNALSYMSIIKHLSSQGVLRYAEITERVSLVNSSWVVSTLWNAIKPFLPVRTQEKLNILNTSASNPHSESSDSIFSLTYGDIAVGKASLPDFIGGSLKDGQHAVCPAMSVDAAYAVVVDEILAAPVPMYPDTVEFLEAALKHAERMSHSPVHKEQVKRIQAYLSAHVQAPDNTTGTATIATGIPAGVEAEAQRQVVV